LDRISSPTVFEVCVIMSGLGDSCKRLLNINPFAGLAQRVFAFSLR
jgi:hypothetical protein